MEKIFYINSSFEAKAFKKGRNSLKIAGYANTTKKDRAGDIVTADAWAKGVGNFRKNPVLLNQHKHDQPIGKVDKITVDKKGIFVEASISEAAERSYGTQTLVRDGALKSFSVGFRVKDGKYNRATDSMMITDVELLEISVVSVPCNQDSLFSVRKSFESNDDYSNFVGSLEETTEKALVDYKAGVTDVVADHYHTIEVDKAGNGITTYASHMEGHSHVVKHGVVQEAEGHTHNIFMMGIPSYDTDEGQVTNERPLSPTEESAMHNKTEDTTEAVEETVIVGEKATIEAIDEEKTIAEEVVEEKATEEVVEEKTVTEEKVSEEITEDEMSIDEEKVLEDEDDEEEIQASDPNETIPFVNLLSVGSLQNGDLVNFDKKMYKVIKIGTAQSPIFKFLEIDAEGKDCDNVLNVNAEEISQVNKINNISEDGGSQDKRLHKDSTKENNPMKEQIVETLDLTEAKAVEKTVEKAVETPVETKSTNSVAEPNVTALVEKTGEAIINEANAKDLGGSDYTPKESEELKEMQATLSKYKDEIKSLQTSKMQYQESTRNKAQFTEKEMADACLLAKSLGRGDVFDTKLGSKMKAVTSVDAFLANFSENVYTEMEQQLVIAPMFKRLSVDAKTFRVPVADEDTDGDVAMFKSGTYATGIGDTTNVPTSNQNTLSSVDFTPHKFMATTHLAKDEEEDTVLALMDFLREAATRRLARAIDKSILRGTGALTGFTASPTNAITPGTGYASVIEGITNLTADASITVSTGSATDKVDPTDIAAARAQMGKYGLQLGNDLVFVTSIEGYNNLVTTSDFRTVDKFGPNATYLTGSVGAVYGIPIAISEFLDGVGTTGNHLGTLIYKPGFMIAERRGMEVESEYEPRQQVTAMYLSTRFDFHALTTNASAALDATNYQYASTILAG